MEFSKLWLISSALLALALTVVYICGVQIVEIVLAAYAELAVSSGFYFWKAKNENRAKYAQRFLQKFADKYGAETALRAAEIVLKE